jgi:energy-coupling factor transporter ATP-binding protein EcfA2
MYIREIFIKSFRHIENASLGPFKQPPKNSDLVVLAGPNGGGKSSILELLGYALSSSWSFNYGLRRNFPTSSFEVAIALTAEERKLAIDYGTTYQYHQNAIEYLRNEGIYYRSFNYSEGQYHKDVNLHDRIHNIVISSLRDHHTRQPGFFLKADRNYPQKGFDRSKIFNFAQTKQKQHLWSLAFNTSEAQYDDMYDFLIQQRYHYFRELGRYHHQIKEQGYSSNSLPSDPLKPYDDLLQRLFPGYRFIDDGQEIPSDLYVQLPTSEIIPFNDLSSGEKEVFFILSFFLRHDVSSAIIVIDEPELHLHPELSRLLAITMQSLKPENQIWMATHNAEIIDEAGRERVLYISRDKSTRKSVVKSGENEEAAQNLKDLFGYSGYIGIAKSMVFLEGVDSSSDRKIFSRLFPNYGSTIKFVPAKTVENLPRLNTALLSILESNLGWMQFYLIRDRDYLTKEIAEHYKTQTSGRMYVLERCHIENYLLIDELIANVQKEIFSKYISIGDVKQSLENIAHQISGEVLRDMIAFRLNLVYMPQDFSMGKMFEGQPVYDAKSGWYQDKLDSLSQSLSKKVEEINQSLDLATSTIELEKLIQQCKSEVQAALESASGTWRTLFPGKRILSEYAKIHGLGQPVIFINSLIKELGVQTDLIPSELQNAIDKIAEGLTF